MAWDPVSTRTLWSPLSRGEDVTEGLVPRGKEGLLWFNLLSFKLSSYLVDDRKGSGESGPPFPVKEKVETFRNTQTEISQMFFFNIFFFQITADHKREHYKCRTTNDGSVLGESLSACVDSGATVGRLPPARVPEKGTGLTGRGGG